MARTRQWMIPAVAFVALVASSLGCSDRTDRVVADPGSRGETTASTAPTTSTTAEAPDSSVAAPTTPPPVPASTTVAPPPPPPPGVVVTEVVDGDTIVVVGGQRVRMIGIDTPERGQCGYYEATAALTALVGLRPVVLVGGARDDVDRYGRLLRYVEVDGVDANLEMLRNGHARARYDSRDGYGRHAREAAYVAADAGAPDRCAQPAAPSTTSAPPPAAPIPPAGGTDPRFGTCREAIAAGFGPYVRGIDPEYDWYRDADGDGVVCE